MRTQAIRTLLGALSPAGRRARLMILSFHRVPETPDALLRNEPSAEVFRERMRWLQSYCKVLPLPEAAIHLRDGTLPPRSAAITFDDGYRNNLTVAAPILRDLGLPATFFIAVNAIETGILWNDIVFEALRRASGRIDLRDLDLGEVSASDDEARRGAIRDIIARVKYVPVRQRWQRVNELYRRSTSEPMPRLMMSESEVRELAEMGFDVGAHTMNHPILKQVGAGEAVAEIRDSRDWVAGVTGQVPRSFAYPNGRPGIDYGPEHVEMVAEAGFEVAVSTRWACADRHCPRLELPRFTPWESDPAGFGLRLVKTAVRSYLPGDG